MEQFVSAGHKVWKGTVGAGEGLWIPPGFLFTEYTSDKEGMVGMKMFGVAVTNLTLMRQLYKKLEGTASKAPLLFVQLLSDVGELVKQKAQPNGVPAPPELPASWGKFALPDVSAERPAAVGEEAADAASAQPSVAAVADKSTVAEAKEPDKPELEEQKTANGAEAPPTPVANAAGTDAKDSEEKEVAAAGTGAKDPEEQGVAEDNGGEGSEEKKAAKDMDAAD